MRLGIVRICALVAFSILLSSAAISFAGHAHGRGCDCDAGPRPLIGFYGVRHCDNCDDAPVVVGGPGIPCGGECGGCATGCGGGACGGQYAGTPLACRLFGWIGQIRHHGKCTGCGPKYIPEWRERPCEPCNNCGDWVGPSIHRGKPYVGAPRSGSNIGTMVSEGVPLHSAPTYAEPKVMPTPAAQPETSVRRIQRSSYNAPVGAKPMPRHRRAAPQSVRTVHVQATQPRTSTQQVRSVIVE